MLSILRLLAAVGLLLCLQLPQDAMRILRLAIDTGYEAPAVYAWPRRSGSAQVAPIEGVESFNRASPVTGPTYVDATSRGKRLRRGAKLWTVAGSTFKAETYRFLRLPRPSDEELDAGATYPAGTVHLPAGSTASGASSLSAVGEGSHQVQLLAAGMAEAERAQ